MTTTRRKHTTKQIRATADPAIPSIPAIAAVLSVSTLRTDSSSINLDNVRTIARYGSVSSIDHRDAALGEPWIPYA